MAPEGFLPLSTDLAIEAHTVIVRHIFQFPQLYITVKIEQNETLVKPQNAHCNAIMWPGYKVSALINYLLVIRPMKLNVKILFSSIWWDIQKWNYDKCHARGLWNMSITWSNIGLNEVSIARTTQLEINKDENPMNSHHSKSNKTSNMVEHNISYKP